MKSQNELIRRYSGSGPRYTSYPPVPCWNAATSPADWQRCISSAPTEDGIALYIHLPFCESLCTYCGCNTRITTNHAVEEPYIGYVLREWKMYLELLSDIRISEIHLGGGTPTFFSASNLEYLINSITGDAKVSPHPEFSIEGHPNSTTAEKLKVLSRAGFTRISYGIQDFEPVVQKAIHRFQSVEQVRKVTELARANGFTSVNYDLIYGLPFQTQESIRKTFEAVLELRPDRIAYYGYAHVPWVKPGQRSYCESDLPKPAERIEMYESGRDMLQSAGYVEIGMDHFALPEDSLCIALQQGRLKRNFMGYTTTNAEVMIGLGVSSISDSGTCLAQNEKDLKLYYAALDEGRLPFHRGHELTDTDIVVRRLIMSLMCNFSAEFNSPFEQQLLKSAREKFGEMEADGVLTINNNKITINETGRRFVRNVCMAIDPLLIQESAKPVFSSTV